MDHGPTMQDSGSERCTIDRKCQSYHFCTWYLILVRYRGDWRTMISKRFLDRRKLFNTIYSHDFEYNVEFSDFIRPSIVKNFFLYKKKYY